MNTAIKVGVLGSGDVAKQLASGYHKLGFKVSIGSRDPQKLSEWCSGNQGIEAGTFAEVAENSDLLILAVKGDVAESAMALLPAAAINNKVIIDTTNPISSQPPVNGVLQYFTNANESLMERLQKAFPSAHFVKAFNSVGNNCMINPQCEVKPTMFICGNDAEAKSKVSTLLEVAGWEVADFGMVESARAIEHLCMLWCIPGFLKNQWSHVFKLLPANQ